MSHVPVRYPSWRYHASETARVVENADEEKALGPGWSDSPAKVKPVETKSVEAKLPTEKETEVIAKQEAETIAQLADELVKAGESKEETKHHKTDTKHHKVK